MLYFKKIFLKSESLKLILRFYLIFFLILFFIFNLYYHLFAQEKKITETESKTITVEVVAFKDPKQMGLSASDRKAYENSGWTPAVILVTEKDKETGEITRYLTEASVPDPMPEKKKKKETPPPPPNDGTKPPSSGGGCTQQPTQQPTSHSISPRISHGTPIYQSQPRFKNCTYNYCNGCSCVSRTITISFNESCPSSSCSNNCNCCSNNVNCYPQVSFSIFPNRLFVNQVFNLTYKASGPSSCGNLTCQFDYEYKGHNCNVPSALGICPSQAQGKNVCDPENKIPRILQGKTSYPETTISIKADQELWGTYYYKLTCCSSCNNCNSKEASVFVLPILYYQETPFSSIIQPFISLIKK